MAKQVRSLKSHYARSLIVSGIGAALIIVSKKYINPQPELNKIEYVGAGFAFVGGFLMWNAHARLVYRTGKYVFGSKK